MKNQKIKKSGKIEHSIGFRGGKSSNSSYHHQWEIKPQWFEEQNFNPKRKQDVVTYLEVCSVCNEVLHEQNRYPKGYPKEWKVCCYHKKIVELALTNKAEKTYLRYAKKEKEKIEKLFTIGVERCRVV